MNVKRYLDGYFYQPKHRTTPHWQPYHADTIRRVELYTTTSRSPRVTGRDYAWVGGAEIDMRAATGPVLRAHPTRFWPTVALVCAGLFAGLAWAGSSTAEPLEVALVTAHPPTCFSHPEQLRERGPEWVRPVAKNVRKGGR